MASLLDINSLSLSIIIPAFNESQNITKTIENLIALIDVSCTYEILIIDDGSTDDTAAIILNLAKKYPSICLVSHKINKGYGSAIRSGLLHSKYNVIFWTDADGQIDFSMLPQSLTLLKQYEAIIGYRLNCADPLLRKFLRYFGNLINKKLLNIPVRDVGCAFKLFIRDSFNISLLSSSGGFINTQWAQQISINNLKFFEIPIKHYPRNSGIATGGSIKVQCLLWYEWLIALLFPKPRR